MTAGSPRGHRPRAAFAILTVILAALPGCIPGEAPVDPGRRQPIEVVYREERPAGADTYVGEGACRSCHPYQSSFWSATRHAASGASLSTGEAALPECLRCHSTGYGRRGGHRQGEAGTGLDAVACEACHGPSGSHAADPSARRTSGGLDRDCPPCIITRICRECHTRHRSPGFDPDGYLARARCPSDERKDNLMEEGNRR